MAAVKKPSKKASKKIAKKKHLSPTPLDKAADLLVGTLADPEQGNGLNSAELLEADPNLDLPVIRVPVRSLVSFERHDENAWSYVSYAELRDGSRAHTVLQDKLSNLGDYRSEVAFTHTYTVLGRDVEVSGRADGMFNANTSSPIVHEIKSSALPLSDIPEAGIDSHWAQLKCYASLYMELNACHIVATRLTYVERQSGESLDLDRVFTRAELSRFMLDLIKPYVKRENDLYAWRRQRDLSIKSLELPFPDGFRKGQKLLAYNVYRCLGDKKHLFAQAPTGTGKTMGVIYPVLKAMGEGSIERVFYITAKTTTKSIAENTLSLLREKGLRLRSITLTAKDKMCLMEVKNCDPAICPYAEGVISRLQRLSKKLIKDHDTFTRDLIYKAGLNADVCPFELSLELSLYCDLVIADYNYAFDPRVYLKRFFQNKTKSDNVLLIDEAHNLIDRAREMFSANLSRESLMTIRRLLHKDNPELAFALAQILRQITLIQYKSDLPILEKGSQAYRTALLPPNDLLEPINNFLLLAEPLLTENEHPGAEKPGWMDDLVGLFFNLLHFRNTLDLFGSEYRVLQTGKNRHFNLRLLCLDPAAMLQKRMETVRSCVFFSATLSPLTYFRKMLGGSSEAPTLRLASPFPQENLLVLIEDRVETRYKLRDQHIAAVASSLLEFLSARTGNYLVFFPSYGYMNTVFETIETMYWDLKMRQPDLPAWDVLKQEGGMTEKERENWLGRFEEFGDCVRVGFCVLGGAFGEGIDLVGERLTGAAIVGVGLPQVSPQLEITREYFDKRFGEGFDYSYTYPGINRVLQAAGRLIRSSTDKGVLLLLDSRFSKQQYLGLLPLEWLPVILSKQNDSLTSVLDSFWNAKTDLKSPQIAAAEKE